MIAVIKYTILTILVALTLVLILIGLLTITRGTPVTQVIAEGDREGPPEVSDPLFPRSIELFTGTHIEPGNTVQTLLNGEGTYAPLWTDMASATRTLPVQM
jgi:spore germination protein GerM